MQWEREREREKASEKVNKRQKADARDKKFKVAISLTIYRGISDRKNAFELRIAQEVYIK